MFSLSFCVSSIFGDSQENAKSSRSNSDFRKGDDDARMIFGLILLLQSKFGALLWLNLNKIQITQIFKGIYRYYF
jgi:hypothetical protein